LPKGLSEAKQFALAKRCGFDGIESWAGKDKLANLDAAKERGKIAREEGVPIHSLIYGWWPPFTNTDPEVIGKSIKEMEDTLAYAQAVGAGSVLLVPTRVTDDFRYADAYQRSQEYVRRLIPVAERTGVVIALENVWNRFLISPMEFARYIDELNSPWVQAYFDVGNILIHGNPQDWILTLGKRINRLHVKGCKQVSGQEVKGINRGYKFVNLLEGSINWKAVGQAIHTIGYQGWITAEVGGGDEAFLTDLAQRMDKIIAMAS
jgi:L-ribulose-5-phosphate 3-epimerase